MSSIPQPKVLSKGEFTEANFRLGFDRVLLADKKSTIDSILAAIANGIGNAQENVGRNPYLIVPISLDANAAAKLARLLGDSDVQTHLKEHEGQVTLVSVSDDLYRKLLTQQMVDDRRRGM